MAEVRFGFKAIKPILAWHNEREVLFEPGDEVPANEWKGAAVEALIENGKLMRYATNVYAPGEYAGDAPPRVSSASDLPDDRDALVQRIADLEQLVATLTGSDAVESQTGEAAPWPRPQGAGVFELSDGTRVRGKAKALQAQAELDLAAEAV